MVGCFRLRFRLRFRFRLRLRRVRFGPEQPERPEGQPEERKEDELAQPERGPRDRQQCADRRRGEERCETRDEARDENRGEPERDEKDSQISTHSSFYFYSRNKKFTGRTASAGR